MKTKRNWKLKEWTEKYYTNPKQKESYTAINQKKKPENNKNFQKWKKTFKNDKRGKGP